MQGKLKGKEMPPTNDDLASAFDKAMAVGEDNLIGEDREYYLIQDFILQYEIGSLSGYLYNRIPDFDVIWETIDSMREHGLRDLAAILTEAVNVFDGYQEPDPPTTWGNVLEYYDKARALPALAQRICELQDYGLRE